MRPGGSPLRQAVRTCQSAPSTRIAWTVFAKIWTALSSSQSWSTLDACIGRISPGGRLRAEEVVRHSLDLFKLASCRHVTTTTTDDGIRKVLDNHAPRIFSLRDSTPEVVRRVSSASLHPHPREAPPQLPCLFHLGKIPPSCPDSPHFGSDGVYTLLSSQFLAIV